MARYDKDFKLKCIKAYEDGKPLPEIDGVLSQSIYRYIQLWRQLSSAQATYPVLHKTTYPTYLTHLIETYGCFTE